MTATTATLTIDSFRTTLAIPADDGQVRLPHRFNIIGSDDLDGDWHTNPTDFFRSAADRQLREAGYTRTGDWQRGSGWDVHTAPITTTCEEPAA